LDPVKDGEGTNVDVKVKFDLIRQLVGLCSRTRGHVMIATPPNREVMMEEYAKFVS